MDLIDVPKFISAYQNARCLWDPSHSNHGSLKIRTSAVEEMVSEFGISGNFIFTNLLLVINTQSLLKFYHLFVLFCPNPF